MTKEELIEIAVNMATRYSTDRELIHAAQSLAATIPEDHWLRTNSAATVIGMAKGYFRAKFVNQGMAEALVARRAASFINFFMGAL